jgi:hypothetical protein
MSTRASRLPVLLGTVTAALVLGACGANEPGLPESAGTESPLSPQVTATPSSSAPAGSSAPSTSPSASGGPSAGEAADDPGAELEVADQRGDGRSVNVQQASTTAGSGFVAVYRQDQLLGSVAVGSGTLTVRLDSPVPASGELLAVLFGDDGDGTFDGTLDPRFTDEDFDYTLS